MCVEVSDHTVGSTKPEWVYLLEIGLKAIYFCLALELNMVAMKQIIRKHGISIL